MRAPEPPAVAAAMMVQDWRLISFVHWRYPIEAVAPLVPQGLRVETFDGSAWVGLLPFAMRRVRLPGVPPVPWLSAFPETNLRTYVIGPDGRPGIYFFSLEAARLPAVLTARLGLGLPYQWSAASLQARDGCLVYWGRRRWPRPAGVGYEARVRIGLPIPESELGPLDHFLTARYRLYTTVAGRLVAVDAGHPPWKLYRAALEHLHEDLTSAAGLPLPAAAPLVHASPGVRARIGLPELIRA